MSVYNRKMFKPRNTRNALNRTAGIPSVARFQVGGSVLPPRQRVFGAIPTIPNVAGQRMRSYSAPDFSRSMMPRANMAEIARRYVAGEPITASEFSALRGAEQGFLSRKGLGDSLGAFGDTRLGSGIKALLGPVAETGGQIRGFTEGAAGSAAQFLLGSSDGSAPADTVRPPELSSDYLKSLGIETMDLTNLQSQSARGGFPSPSSVRPRPTPTTRQYSEGPEFFNDPEVKQRLEDERMAREAMARDGVVVTNEEAELKASGILPGNTENIEAALDNQMREQEALQAAVDAADRDEATVDQSVMKDGTETPPDGTDASGDPSETGTTGTVPSTKEEIDKVINQGSEADQKAALDGFIKEFMDAAPGYEGADSGLIFAKIGFAMAAGKSPRAIENIASALEGGADMLIKDKAKKDEFGRQLKLSALQYGLGEVGKIRAEERVAEREGRKLNYFVADGDVTIGDRTYKKGETVPVTTEFIRDNGLPSNLTTVELAKAAITANSAYQKALLTAKGKNVIDAKTYGAITKDLNEATTDFVSAHQLRQVVQRNLITNAEGGITGVGPAFQQLVNRAFAAAGVDAGEDYENVDQFNQDMRRVSNSLLKDLLGEGSKNVSNIDRKLADEIVGLYAGFGGYIFQDEQLLNQRLQNVLATLERKERNALNVFQGAIDSTEGMTFRSGKDISLNIPESARAALQGQGSSALNFQQGEDGVFRRV